MSASHLVTTRHCDVRHRQVVRRGVTRLIIAICGCPKLKVGRSSMLMQGPAASVACSPSRSAMIRPTSPAVAVVAGPAKTTAPRSRIVLHAAGQDLSGMLDGSFAEQVAQARGETWRSTRRARAKSYGWLYCAYTPAHHAWPHHRSISAAITPPPPPPRHCLLHPRQPRNRLHPRRSRHRLQLRRRRRHLHRLQRLHCCMHARSAAAARASAAAKAEAESRSDRSRQQHW